MIFREELYLSIKKALLISVLLVAALSIKAQVANELGGFVSKSDSVLVNDSIEKLTAKQLNFSKSQLYDSLSLLRIDSVRFESLSDSFRDVISDSSNIQLLDSATINSRGNKIIEDNSKALLKESNIDISNDDVENVVQESKNLKEIDSSYISDKAQQVLESNAPKEIQQIKNKELEEFKDVKAQLDSGNTEMLESKIEDFAKNNLEEAEALEQVEQFNTFRNDFPFQSQEDFQWDKGKIASAAKVGSLLTEQQSKISEATDKVGKLKKKYSHYSLGDDSKELKKRNVPQKRWQLHMNLESSIRPHLVIKAAPGLSFNTTSKHNIGIATSFDYQYHYKDSSYQQFSKQLSVRLFSQYKFYKQLFVQAEYEQPYLNTTAAHEGTLLYLKRQSAKVWLGGGFEYKVYKKLRAQTQILYNLSPPKRLEEAASRWAIRINLIY
ncbi:hypothetical protein GCM10027429_19480 [Marivirga atlantica]